MKKDIIPKILSIGECTESQYIKLKRINYDQDGVVKAWDVASVHDSVAVIIYNRDNQSLILVKQFRPPVYLKNNDGFTYELCAGITDKDKSLAEIAKEEILEETGYDVELESINKLTSFYTAVSFAGSIQTLFFVEVGNSQKVNSGGGVGNEKIEVVEISLSEVFDFVWDEEKAKTPGIMFAFQWVMQQDFYKQAISC